MWQNRISTINRILMAMKNRSDSLWIIGGDQPVECSCVAVAKVFSSFKMARLTHGEREEKKQKERKREKEISDDIACVKMFEFGTLLLKIRINNQAQKRLWNVLLRYAIFLRSCWSFGRMILGPTNCISNPVSFHSQKSMAICPFCSLCVFTSFSWFDSIHQKKKIPSCIVVLKFHWTWTAFTLNNRQSLFPK